MRFDSEKGKLLNSSEQFLHDIINNMVDPIFVKDDKSRLVLVNDSFCSIFNVPKDQVLGKTLAEHVPKNEREQFFKIDNEVLSSGNEDISEETLTINGKTSIIITKKNRFVSENGDKYLLGSIHDITKIKEAEKALVASQRDKTMGEMASSIAHDFNNSLQALQGNIELAKLEKDTPSNILKYFECIESIVFDVKGRVNSLQRFGDINYEFENKDHNNINLLLEEITQELRPIWKNEMERKGISINIYTELKSTGTVKSNKGELKTVFYNLLKNSIESFKDKQKGEIKIYSSNQEGKVLIRFEDNGCGMTAETAENIFNPFFTTKGLQAGRGLGMSGAYGIIRGLKGTLILKESYIDKGSVFEISLPYSNSKQVNEKKIPEDVILDKKMKVLWVEDDAIIGMNAQELVKSLGYSCELAESASEAIKIINESSFDYVITDIGLGGMTGLELSKYIKENHKNIKVAVVSGWKVNDEEKVEFGVCCSITKPFNLNILKACLEQLQNN